MATTSAGQHAPLTHEHEELLLESLNLRRDQVSRIEGAVGIGDGHSATADVYGEITETPDGNCAAVHFWIDGKLVDGQLQWDARTDNELRSRLDEVVWLGRHRLGRPCSSLLENNFLTLRTPIEEQTLVNLDRSAAILALEAASRVRLGPRYSEDQIRDGRIRTIEVGNIRTSGTYRLEWMINQCNGLSMWVETDAEGKFSLADAKRILC